MSLLHYDAKKFKDYEKIEKRNNVYSIIKLFIEYIHKKNIYLIVDVQTIFPEC